MVTDLAKALGTLEYRSQRVKHEEWAAWILYSGHYFVQKRDWWERVIYSGCIT